MKQMTNQKNSLKGKVSNHSVFTVFSVYYKDGKTFNHLHLGVAKDLDEAFANSKRQLEKAKGHVDSLNPLYYTSIKVEGVLHKVGLTSEEITKRHSALMKMIIQNKDDELLGKVKPIMSDYELKYIKVCREKQSEQENLCSPNVGQREK